MKLIILFLILFLVFYFKRANTIDIITEVDDTKINIFLDWDFCNNLKEIAKDFKEEDAEEFRNFYYDFAEMLKYELEKSRTKFVKKIESHCDKPYFKHKRREIRRFKEKQKISILNEC